MLGELVSTFALRPAATAVALARRAEREARSVALDAAGRATLSALDGVLTSRYTDEAVRRVLASQVAERALDEVIEQLLRSRELWLLVDEIARSPAVTEAIAHQSVGFADQVAGEVRVRSRRADARLERTARRVLRRAP